jgi:Cytochrome P450
MVLYPEAQHSAQAEIDGVLEGLRLPEFSDEADLPYVDAIVKEVLRWHPVGPLGTYLPYARRQLPELMLMYPAGIPHRVTQDDSYEGYFIPAGSIVIGNIWYGAPPTFCPEPFRSPHGSIQGDDARPYSVPRTEPIPPGTLARAWCTCVPRPDIRVRAA